MNILIVGNGFDLSHYLPTKYDHFMVAMQAIENWEVSKGDMSFDDLFGALYEKEDYFFGYTKAMYKTDELKISVDQIKELQEKLKDNVWYQYFSDHVREVKTWIDFENKIGEALNLVCKFIKKIDIKFDKYGKFDKHVELLTNSNADKDDSCIYVSVVELKFLIRLKFIIENDQYGQSVKRNGFVSMPDSRRGFINDSWYLVQGKNEYGFSNERYIGFLNKELDDFISIFNRYLNDIVKCLKPYVNFKFKDQKLINIDMVYSFNYTNTYQNFYNSEQDIEFLHGCIGEEQNIVLGISEINESYLKKIKAYGFTKYHQKLLKDTDYQFLSNNCHAINIKSFWKSVKDGRVITLEDKSINGINIYIWGHSLDISDESYINEIFSFNGEYDEQLRVTIYFFNQTAKFDLLANLIHILEKDKVELWMKKGWLKFEKNLDIAKINDIEPIVLPKVTSKSS
ncbi:AbiH family protein [Acinetobacter sp. UBA6720]|uniref:AbiH family protein n=1 Tax=Acinetobacter sp. UBA6720 TaxID=1945953 RepID=UPI0025BB7140|nr:AbiH family protein [Acinetobacter sp. UBA6720]